LDLLDLGAIFIELGVEFCDKLLEFERFSGSAIPSVDILLGDFWAFWRFSFSNFNGLATTNFRNYIPNIGAVLVKNILFDFVHLQVVNLHLHLLREGNLVVSQSLQVIDLYLLLAISLLSSHF
jgi:hypothetical protein